MKFLSFFILFFLVHLAQWLKDISPQNKMIRNEYDDNEAHSGADPG